MFMFSMLFVITNNIYVDKGKNRQNIIFYSYHRKQLLFLEKEKLGKVTKFHVHTKYSALKKYCSVYFSKY